MNVRSVCLLIVLSVLAACTRVATAPHAAGGANAWTRPGALRIAMRQDPDNLNPLLGTQTVDTDLSMLWAGYLFNWSDRDELVPELAQRVPSLANGDISADGKTIIYHLRRGVRWQDGAPFTADDVIYTWQQIMNPRNFTVSHAGYDIIRGIDRRDDATVAVHLSKSYAPFVNNFLTMGNHPYSLLPKHLLEQFANLNRVEYNSHPIGTGPFKIASYEKGQRLRLVANQQYWRGPPKLKEIDVRIIPNDNTILTLARSHEIDLYYHAPEALVPTLRTIPGMTVIITPFTRFIDLGLNASTPALSDLRVRQALAYATDRESLVNKITHGVALIGDSDQPATFWAHNPHVKSYPYDPKRAAALLDAAGWKRGNDGLRRKDGEPLRLSMVSFTGSSTNDQSEAMIQREWREAGVDVVIKNFPSSQLYATKGMGGIEQSGKFDVVFEGWSNGIDPDDSILFRCGMAPPAGWNVYHFCDPQLERAETAALSSNDRRVRKAAYDTVQSRLAEGLPIILLWYQQELDVANTDFHNYRPAHAVTPLWNTWEWSI